MLAAQLINTSFPSVHLLDKASFALQLMDDYDVQHLCVVTDEKLVGIVDKNTLLDIDETAVIATLQDEFITASVHADAHFLAGAKLLSLHELTMLPVVSAAADLLGVITAKHMLAAHTLEKTFPKGTIISFYNIQWLIIPQQELIFNIVP
jgi:acetoin utilization protein AcuB